MEDLRIKKIKRKEKLTILVNGKPCTAYGGENLLAVLLASGYKGFYRHPADNTVRGGLCGMGVCFDCLVTVDGKPRVRACMTQVKDGMVVEIDE